MKDFFKMMLASASGYFIASTAMSFFFLFSLSFLALLGGTSGGPGDTDLKENSVLRLNLMGEIVEKDSNFNFHFGGPMGFSKLEPQIGLWDVRKALESAAKNDSIKGLYLRFYYVDGGWASVEALRRALETFKKSGKFIIAYADFYTEAALYLSSVADEVFLYPQGYVENNGFASVPSFFKGTLEKLDIKPIVFRVGDFKSAVEPFIRESMSSENRKQVSELLSDLWTHYLAKTSEGREFKAEELNTWAESLEIVLAKDAMEKKLVSQVMTESQAIDEIKIILGMDEKKEGKDKDPHFIGYRAYNKASGDTSFAKDKIAVVMAEGQIMYGENDDDTLGSESFVEQIREIQKDKNVKGLVVRVDSPGGDAMAADIMYEELKRLKEKKKIPIYVSFSNVAASGGYYLAAGADKIYAESTTITGSIGVFGLVFNTQKFFDENLGMKFDRVVTNSYADNRNPNREMTDFEKAKVQAVIENIYERFITIVKEGRKFESLEAVDKIAGGRVWSGTRAKEIGLVDEIGGLPEAIDALANEAKVESYQVKFFPGEKNPFEMLIKRFASLVSSKLDLWFSDTEIEKLSAKVKEIKSLQKMQGVQARMPFDLEVQ